MVRIEHEHAVPAIHLVVRQIPRRRRELRNEIPVRRAVGARRIERAASPRGQLVPACSRHASRLLVADRRHCSTATRGASMLAAFDRTGDSTIMRATSSRAPLSFLILLGRRRRAAVRRNRCGRARPTASGCRPSGSSGSSDALQAYVDDGKVAGSVTLVARRGRIAYFEAFGQPRPRSERADADRRDLPHRVAVEGDRQRRRDDARRGRQAAADGSRRQIPARVHGDEGRRRARRRRLRRREGRAADHGPRLADAHVGLRLRHRRRRRPVDRRRPDRLLLRGQERDDPRLRAPHRERCRRTRSPARSGSTATTPTSWARSSRSSPASRSTKCLRERIFEPLGMRDTEFYLSPRQGESTRRPCTRRTRASSSARRRRATPSARATTSTGRARISRAAPACCRRRRTTPASCKCC